MSSTASILRPALNDLDDALADFRSAVSQNAESVLRRYIYVLDSEPLSGFLKSALPINSFTDWWKNVYDTSTSMVGSGELDWPPDRAERISLQIQLCRVLAADEIQFDTFVLEFCRPSSNSLSAHEGFAAVVLSPLTRDIKRLTEHRPLPPFLIEAMGNLPRSGDATLDRMLADASRKFRDPAPDSRRDAVERLWDAWERIKSLEVPNNKKESVQRLLDRAVTEPEFRQLIEIEAKALTDIGNQFHIRHFEADRTQLTAIEHYDYLFHRLYALIHLLLFSRSTSNDT